MASVKKKNLQSKVLEVFHRDQLAQKFNSEADIIRRLHHYIADLPDDETFNQDDVSNAYDVAIGWLIPDDATTEDKAFAMRYSEARCKALGLS